MFHLRVRIAKLNAGDYLDLIDHTKNLEEELEELKHIEKTESERGNMVSESKGVEVEILGSLLLDLFTDLVSGSLIDAIMSWRKLNGERKLTLGMNGETIEIWKVSTGEKRGIIDNRLACQMQIAGVKNG